MNERLDQIIAKINHLRKLAGNNSNPSEAENAAKAANALLEKHQLSEMDLQVRGEKEAEPVEMIDEHLYESGRIMLWIHRLAEALCDAYGCTYWIDRVHDPMKLARKNPRARRSTYLAFKVVGRRSDWEIVKYMFTWLQPEIERLTKLNAYGQGMTYAQSYALGLVKGIRLQFEEQKRETHREAALLGQSQAMVLLDNRKKEAEERRIEYFKEQEWPIGGVTYTHQRTTDEAFSRGVERGKKIQLTKGLGSGKDPKRLK